MIFSSIPISSAKFSVHNFFDSRIKLVRFRHLLNERQPKLYTEDGINTDTKFLQLANAYSPIEVTEFGIFIDVSDEQAQNASSFIEEIEFGIYIEVKLLHS